MTDPADTGPDAPTATPRQSGVHAERNVTVEEALVIAIRCQQHGQLAEAEALYRAVLDTQPACADALHFLGVLAQQQGRTAEALTLIEQSVELSADRADWHANLGRVHQDSGNAGEAIRAYRRALELDPGHANTHNNLGVLLKASGLLSEAEDSYRTAIRLNPTHADAYHNLAALLGAAGRTEEAVMCYSRALTLRPHSPETSRMLALAYCIIGEPEKAVRLCEQWVEADPSDPVAAHTLAAVSGREVPARASDAYVQRTFDSFAATFEARLAQLHYRAPHLVAEALAASGLPAARQLTVLDAGCGTGLCGPLVAPFARRLVGVDLSAGMLEHAHRKNVYDELTQGELTSYLSAHSADFDVIICADTLVYFGALDDVAAAAARALRPGGRFIFTVEEETRHDAPPFGIKAHGRFNHAAPYVERTLTHAGCTVAIARAVLRMESGLPVQGLVVVATTRVHNFSD